MFSAMSFSMGRSLDGPAAAVPMAVDSMGTQDMGVKAAKKEDKVSILPVTVRMLEDSTRNSGLVHGTEPGMLILVGCVESMTKQASSVEFVLNDATGRMRVRYFGGEGDRQLENVEVGRYVSVAATLRTSPAVHLSAMNLRLVRSADEVSFHMIEVAHAMLKLTRPRSAIAPVKEATMVTTPSPKRVSPAADVNMEVVTPPKESTAPAFAAPEHEEAKPASFAAPSPAAPGNTLVGAPLRDAIKAILQEEANAGREEGLHKDVISRRLAPTPQAQVLEAINELVDGGDVYSTVDDDHFGSLA